MSIDGKDILPYVIPDTQSDVHGVNVLSPSDGGVYRELYFGSTAAAAKHSEPSTEFEVKKTRRHRRHHREGKQKSRTISMNPFLRSIFSSSSD
jgi:hypothetical protein